MAQDLEQQLLLLARRSAALALTFAQHAAAAALALARQYPVAAYWLTLLLLTVAAARVARALLAALRRMALLVLVLLALAAYSRGWDTLARHDLPAIAAYDPARAWAHVATALSALRVFAAHVAAGAPAFEDALRSLADQHRPLRT